MLKNILYITGILFFLTQSVSAVSYSSNSGKTHCNSSNYNTNSGKKYIPTSNNFNAPSSNNNLGCTKHGYYGGSWSSWKNKGSNYSCPNNGYVSSFQETSTTYRVYCMQLDDTTPTMADITSSISDNSYIKAGIGNIKITASNAGGAPITSIKTEFDGTQSSSENYMLEVLHDYSDVDSDRNSNNYRPYKHKILEVCDAAGNCLKNKEFTYNVYAQKPNSVQSIISTSELDGGNSVADGQPKELKITLKDMYGNKVLPVYKADNALVRSISFTTQYDNDLYLDQYTKTGDSSVFVKGFRQSSYQNTLIGDDKSITQTIQDKANDSGDYNQFFRVYTPTSEAYDKAFGDFQIDTIQVKVSDLPGETLSLLQNIKFAMKPLLKTEITGDILTSGLYATQGLIKVLKDTNTSIGLPNDRNLYLEFGSGTINTAAQGHNFIYEKNSNFETMGEGNGSKTQFQNNFSTGIDYTLNFERQDEETGMLDQIKNLYLSSHISYTLDGKPILYNSDIISKDNYWGNFKATLVEAPKGLKVLGITHSNDQRDILSNQANIDINTLGNIQKFELKSNIRKAAFQVVKNLNVNNQGKTITGLGGTTWNDQDGGVKSMKDKILYFGNLSGENVILNSTQAVEGEKTIIIEGGNLYIKSNISNAAGSNILGIIVLTDENGQGGNIYIDPSVTGIDAIIYTDKSLLSYNETEGILNTNQHNALLKNQLYIYGSIFSENTIGGSKVPYKCPYYISDCNSSTSKQYDFNYLRSYQVLSSTTPMNAGENYFSKDSIYYTYPFVVKYNSRLQVAPPPLFGN